MLGRPAPRAERGDPVLTSPTISASSPNSATGCESCMAGRVVETGDDWGGDRRPPHPYTRRLIACVRETWAGPAANPRDPGPAPPPVDDLPPGCPSRPLRQGDGGCTSGESRSSPSARDAVRCIHPESDAAARGGRMDGTLRIRSRQALRRGVHALGPQAAAGAWNGGPRASMSQGGDTLGSSRIGLRKSTLSG